jgi:phage-related protein
LTCVIKYGNIKEKIVPRVEVVLYCEADGRVPVRDWLDRVPSKVRDKCLAALERLEELGNELRRPVADYLQDGIFELRVHFQTVNYRMLYFFAGRRIVVVSHGLVKERRIPAKELELAGQRRQAFLDDPKAHSSISD